jgi:uncharacterized membrane protein YebE (DUF533 family)
MFDARKLLTQMMGGTGKDGAASASATMNEVGGLIGAVFGQSVQGLKEGAAEIEKRTGVGGKVSGAMKDATGQSPTDLVNQLKDLASRNKVATGAAAAGIGALLLGTRTGRGIAGGAAKMGGLALIGGLAYKAWQNHQAGKPLIDRGDAGVATPPAESPFGETGHPAQDDATSLLMVRAMIAAAASDGAIDNAERSRIVGGLEQAGMDVHAAKFLDAEFASPASAKQLAADARTPEVRAQVYTAARLAIDPDNAKEKAFLAGLAAELGLDAEFLKHIEATAAAQRG